MKTFNIFSQFFGLKSNTSKCEITGISALNGVKIAVGGVKSTDFTTDFIKILGTYFSYKQK